MEETKKDKSKYWIKSGMKVMVSTGGPTMTVDYIDQRQKKLKDGGTVLLTHGAVCKWFEGDELKVGTFNTNALVKVQ